MPVCLAIQHAHMKGVIHRDIKPSNVLVALHDETPVPKVIDFGVAKAVGQQLTEKTIYTGFGALVGTPAYMAPEQATFNQLDIDTRADVYALGVLLYELLAGSPPFEPERLKHAALDEMLRLVREEEPQRPSQRLSTSQSKATIAATRQSDPAKLANLIRGELDWIVMKSLEKDRARRYDSAAGLAKDVERYLADEPVEACPPTLGYRLKKAYRKNRAAVLTATAVFLGALLAIAGQTLNVLRARAGEADALAARNAEADQRDETARERDAALAAKKEATQQRNDAIEAGNKLLRAQDELRDTQYTWDMQMMPTAWDAGSIDQARRLLDRYRPPAGGSDRRGFEWYYWDRQHHAERRLLQLPVAPASAPGWVFGANGTRVLAVVPAEEPRDADGGKREVDQLLKVWDVGTGKEVLSHVLKRSRGQAHMSRAVFSRDGTRVAVSWAVERRPAIPNPDGTLTPYRQVRVWKSPRGRRCSRSMRR